MHPRESTFSRLSPDGFVVGIAVLLGWTGIVVPDAGGAA
jgi:hypothetical protein